MSVRPGLGLTLGFRCAFPLPSLGTGLGLGLGFSCLTSFSSGSSVSVSCWRTDLVFLAGVRAVLFTEEGVVGSGVSPRAKDARLVRVGVLTSKVDEFRRVRRVARGEAVPFEARNNILRLETTGIRVGPQLTEFRNRIQLRSARTTVRFQKGQATSSSPGHYHIYWIKRINEKMNNV